MQLCKIWVAHSSIDEYTQAFCDVMACWLVSYRHYGWACCRQLWRWRRQARPKCQYPFANQHDITSQKLNIYYLAGFLAAVYWCSAVPSCFSPLISHNDLWKWQVTDIIFILWLYSHTQHYSKINQAWYWEESNYSVSSSDNILTKSFGLWLRCILNLYLTVQVLLWENQCLYS
jgi:hypothetical protein